MRSIVEFIIIQIIALLVMVEIITVDYTVKIWISRTQNLVATRWKITYLRILNPVVAIVILAFIFSQLTTFWAELTSFSIEIAILFYFILFIHRKLFIYIYNISIVIVLIITFKLKIQQLSITHDYFYWLILFCCALLIIITNIMFFSKNFITKQRYQLFFLIFLYSFLWWGILSTQKNLAFIYFLGQSISSMMYILISLLLDYIVRSQWQALNQETVTDFLTQIGNRKAFDHAIKHVFNKYKSDWYLVMFDIDDFKKINDLYGHTLGDVTLRTVSRVISEQLQLLPLSTSFFRVGGEEFAILISNTDEEQVLHTMTQIKSSIDQLQLMNRDNEVITITLSVGIAKPNEFDQNIKSVYERADSYLYIAKNSGKNMVNYEGANIVI